MTSGVGVGCTRLAVHHAVVDDGVLPPRKTRVVMVRAGGFSEAAPPETSGSPTSPFVLIMTI
ncbi:hypothetical protein GCM10010272_42350 [Streptomyces lateritius]|nr:hypothetical protein GCM10010272_42350 [Streptomyces lateritius]